MGSAGDEGAVDPQPRPDSDETDAGGSFDPGLETGYLRRAPRDRELSPELGAAPFDPGPGHYDERRALKEARRREREARRRREAQQMAQADRAETRSLASGPASQGAALQRVPEPEPEPMPAAPIPEPEREPAPVTELRPRRESLADRREREREALMPVRKSTRSKPAPAHIEPGVKGPVRKRARAAENRARVASRRRGLVWPTAKAGLAVTVALALGGALGSFLGLPVPGLDQTTGNQSLVNSASLFGIDPGTPAGLVRGYVFPLLGPHDFGDKIARFGAPRYGHIHEGQDIFGKTGTPEVAVHDGIVVDRGKNSDPNDGGRGNYVVLYSPSGNHSFVYMHMLKPSPALVGKHVHAGQLIGRLGCTGSCEGPHLHFEVRVGRATPGAETKPVDPLPYLRGWPQATPG
jgi:murein DD-endopeptidase MepM/ murein hydrolase activator NlpD